MKQKILAIILGITLALQATAPIYAMEPEPTDPVAESITTTEGDTTEYIVRVEDTQALEQIVTVQDEAVVEETLTEELKEEELVVLELTEEEAEALEERTDVVSVEENIILHANGKKSKKHKQERKDTKEKKSKKKEPQVETPTEEVPTETKKSYKEQSADWRGEQWNLEAIHQVLETDNREAVRVGVLDSGVSYTSDLNVAMRIGVNKDNEEENVLFDDASGHGTSIAGMIGALDDENGIRGVYPGAEICSIRVLDENNQTTLSHAVAGIYQAIEADCDILNMSFGTSVNSATLHEAIRAAYDAGILLVAAAGNQEGGAVEYPAAYPEVMAVGATDSTGNKMTDTSDGTDIEIFAPGSQIPTTGLFGGTLIAEGTSISAAQVSGAAAMLWAKDASKSAGFIRSLLKNTAQNVENPGASGAGLLDMEQALAKYGEMEESYVEDVCEYEQVQEESKDAEAFEDVELVNGLWSKDVHQSLVNNETQGLGIKGEYVTLMAEVAASVDRAACRNVGKFHGTKNYVKTVKFLYHCALYLRSGKSVGAAVDEAARIANIGSNQEDAELIRVTKKKINSKVDAASKKKKSDTGYYTALGIAMHTVGDVYAHRTIVPKYTVASKEVNKIDSTNVTSANARFGTTHFKVDDSHTGHSDAQLKAYAKSSAKLTEDGVNICKNWKCFERTVNLGVMEFRDVKYFMKNNIESPAQKYEDCTGFCIERFVDAEAASYYLLTSAESKDVFAGIYLFEPVQNNVKLNNFKNYAKEAGENIKDLTAAKWNKVSTPEQY